MKCLLAPIVIDSTNKSIEINMLANGYQQVDVTEGTYDTIESLAVEVQSKLNTLVGGITFTVTLNTASDEYGAHLTISCSSDTYAIPIVVNDTIWRILGHPALVLTGYSSSHTLYQAPLYMICVDGVSYDQDTRKNISETNRTSSKTYVQYSGETLTRRLSFSALSVYQVENLQYVHDSMATNGVGYYSDEYTGYVDDDTYNMYDRVAIDFDGGLNFAEKTCNTRYDAEMMVFRI